MIIHEQSKILKNRRLMLFFILLIVVNSCILIYRMQNENTYYQPTDYKSLYAQIEGMEPDEAYLFLEENYTKLQAFMALYSEENDPAYFESLGVDMTDIAAAYHNSEYYEKNDLLIRDIALYTDVIGEISLLRNYDSYLQNIDDQANQMTLSVLFANKNSYSYRNVRKTPGDFVDLKGLKLDVGPSAAFELALNSPATDVILVIVVFSLVLFLVTTEKENGSMILTNTMANGGRKNGLSKLFACLLLLAGAVLVLYVMNLITAGSGYGFGNWSRYIQSIAGMNESALKMTVYEFVAAFLASKILGIWTVTLLVFLAAVIMKTIPGCFGITAGAVGIFGILYFLIPKYSLWSIFKYANPIAFLQTFDLYALYQNRNLFGYPVSALKLFFICTGICCVCLIPLILYLYGKMEILHEYRRGHAGIVSNLKRKPHLLGLESEKILIFEKIIFVLLILLIVRIAAYRPLTVYVTQDEIYYNQYINEVQGIYTEEKADYLFTEQSRLNEIQDKFNTVLSEGGGNNVVLILRYNELLAPKTAVDRLCEHASYLKDKNNAVFMKDDGWLILTGGGNDDNTTIYLALVMSVIVLLCTSEIYGIEYRSQMTQIIQTTVNGKKQLRTKFLLLCGLLLISYVIVYAPYYYRILSAYGIYGIMKPAYCMEHLSWCSLPILVVLIGKAVIRLLGYLIQILLVRFCAKRIQNRVLVIVIGILVLIVPLLLVLFQIPGSSYILLNPLLG